MSYLAQNVKYPLIAQEAKVEGRVIVQFIVERDGSVSNVETINYKRLNKETASVGEVNVVGYEIEKTSDDTESSEQALKTEAERVVTAMAKWEPGKQSGETVRVKFVLPITFSLQ